jgi:hypothetical protein
MAILERLRGKKVSVSSARSPGVPKVVSDDLIISNLYRDEDASMSPTVHESFSSLDSESFSTPSVVNDVANHEKLPPIPYTCTIPKATIGSQPATPVVLPARSSLKKDGSPTRSAILLVKGCEKEIQVPGVREPIRRKSCIVFVETVRIKRVRPVGQLVDNPHELWFQGYEYDIMRKKARMLVRKVEYGMTGGKKFCLRGLEGMMHGAERIKHRNKGWAAVLQEQDRQFCRGVFDEDRIAKAYLLSSLHSRLEASHRGVLDHDDAKPYYAHFQQHRRSSGILQMSR